MTSIQLACLDLAGTTIADEGLRADPTTPRWTAAP